MKDVHIVKMTISIGETINLGNYESVKPEITVEFNWDELKDQREISEIYQELYPEVKRLFNMHLYNLLFDVQTRREADSPFSYVLSLKEKGEKSHYFKKETFNVR